MTPEQLAEVTAAATSPDGLVTAVAGALGDLRELRLDPRHQRNRDAEALAATIRSHRLSFTENRVLDLVGHVPYAK